MSEKKGGKVENSLFGDIKKEIFDDNKFHLQKHGSLANIGVEQVQKIHSTVKIIRNKNHACMHVQRDTGEDGKELSILYVPLCHKNCDSTAQV